MLFLASMVVYTLRSWDKQLIIWAQSQCRLATVRVLVSKQFFFFFLKKLGCFSWDLETILWKGREKWTGLMCWGWENEEKYGKHQSGWVRPEQSTGKKWHLNEVHLKLSVLSETFLCCQEGYTDFSCGACFSVRDTLSCPHRIRTVSYFINYICQGPSRMPGW